MSLRWIEQDDGTLVAGHGAYRLRIKPNGLVFQVSLFWGSFADTSRDPQLLVSTPAASLGDGKRQAEALLASALASPAAAQGGL